MLTPMSVSVVVLSVINPLRVYLFWAFAMLNKSSVNRQKSYLDTLFTHRGSEASYLYHGVSSQQQDQLDKMLYQEAAKRVIFNNCKPLCGLEGIVHFDKDFYHHKEKERYCLEDCYNTRMKLHFGSAAVDERMVWDMKRRE